MHLSPAAIDRAIRLLDQADVGAGRGDRVEAVGSDIGKSVG